MFKWFERHRIIKNRQKDKVDIWKKEIIEKLLDFIVPEGEPFYYDSAFSFLQKSLGTYIDPIKLIHSPVRLTLFLPDFPLAIDVVGADGRPNYFDSKRYISRSGWDLLQSELSIKTEKLELYKCPYLIIRDYDPVDISSIRERVKALSDRGLRS